MKHPFSPVQKKQEKTQKYSTATVDHAGNLVPWLAATGPLSFSPQNPPETDFLFRYKKIMPDIFYRAAPDEVVKRESGPECVFGEKWGEDFQLLHFWREARRGHLREVWISPGGCEGDSVRTPIAVYQMALGRHDYYVLMQNGSYQYFPVEQQPLLENGAIVIHRGIHEDKNYVYQLVPEPTDSLGRTAVACYQDFAFHSFSDSRNAILLSTHFICRSQTDHLFGRTKLDDHLKSLDSEPELRDLVYRIRRASLHQRFSLFESIAKENFGPNYVTAITRIDNIRLTPHFAGEGEVTLVDPNKIEFIAAHGCGIYTCKIPFSEK